MVRIGSLGTDGIEPKGVVMMGKEFVPVAECELAAAGANTVDDVDEWWSRARCRGLPTEMFFVPDGDRGVRDLCVRRGQNESASRARFCVNAVPMR